MKKTILFLLVIMITSCAPIVRYNSYDSIERTAKSENIDIFTSVNAIPFNYKEIGLITVDDEGWGRSESELINIAIKKGKAIGADGLLVLSQDKQNDGFILTGSVATSFTRRIVRISAIIKTSDKQLTESLDNNDISSKLIKLKELKDKGLLTEDEFKNEKRKILESL